MDIAEFQEIYQFSRTKYESHTSNLNSKHYLKNTLESESAQLLEFLVCFKSEQYVSYCKRLIDIVYTILRLEHSLSQVPW